MASAKDRKEEANRVIEHELRHDNFSISKKGRFMEDFNQPKAEVVSIPQGRHSLAEIYSYRQGTKADFSRATIQLFFMRG